MAKDVEAYEECEHCGRQIVGKGETQQEAEENAAYLLLEHEKGCADLIQSLKEDLRSR